MLIKVLLAVTLAVHVQADSVCPDKKQQCDSDHTCCHLPLAVAGSEWGCCPFENGVCCADGSTCCPANHLCVPGKRACVSNEPIVTKIQLGSELKPSVAISEPQSTRSKLLGRSSGNVHRFEMPLSRATDEKADANLEDAKSQKQQASGNCTAAQETPCSASTCCPLPQAVCCPNQRHCCPSATTCDLTVARCVAGSGPEAVKLPLYSQFSIQQTTPVRQPSHKTKTEKVEEPVRCPDNSTCPDGSTCCVKDAGDYGCCPLVNAVCCEDKQHCCPEGTTCDIEHKRCNGQDGSYMGFFEKFAAHKTKTEKVE